MHIAECSDSFVPVVDGVGRVVNQYACWLALRGHECYVITPLQNTGYRGSFPFEILDFTSLDVPTAPQYQTGIALLDRHYLDRLAMVSLDIMHVHSPGFSGVEGLRLADKLNIPVVGTFHSKYREDVRRITHSNALASLGSHYVAQFYERCNEVWAVSEDAAMTLRSYGFRNAISVVQNGTEMRTPAPQLEIEARERLLLGQDPIFLYVGQIDYKKNLPLVIDAAALLKKRGHSFQLVFAGQGRDKKRLADLAEERGLDQITFVGHISNRNLLDGLYMAASLFVFPSLYDTAGLVVREAAVMGTPSVVVENTAPAEVVTDGVNGLICSNNPESLCRAMEHYLFEMSKDERADIRKQAQSSIPLPWDEVMADVEARYMTIIANAKRS